MKVNKLAKMAVSSINDPDNSKVSKLLNELTEREDITEFRLGSFIMKGSAKTCSITIDPEKLMDWVQENLNGETLEEATPRLFQTFGDELVGLFDRAAQRIADYNMEVLAEVKGGKKKAS